MDNSKEQRERECRIFCASIMNIYGYHPFYAYVGLQMCLDNYYLLQTKCGRVILEQKLLDYFKQHYGTLI